MNINHSLKSMAKNGLGIVKDSFSKKSLLF